MRIRVINPVRKSHSGSIGALPGLPDHVEAQVDWLPHGPASIESLQDHVLCVPPLLERVERAARESLDGIVISCFMDPGLKAARELVDIPVAGPAESAMLLACSLGQSFSVIIPARGGEAKIVDQAMEYGVRNKLASVRSIEMPVAQFADHEGLRVSLVEAAETAIAEDGCHTLILGCTGMCAITDSVRTILARRRAEVPVIDPVLAAIGMLSAAHVMGVRHSRRAYALRRERRS